MKKLSVKKQILVILVAIATIFVISTAVYATGTQDNPIQIPDITTPSTTDTNTTTNTTNVVENTTVAPTTNTTTNTTVSNYQNTSLPQTGDASDYAIFLIIVLAAVIAVYAYKKVRDYNI